MGKYRIKEITMGDGRVRFVPQYRSLFIWWNFRCGWECEDIREYGEWDEVINFIKQQASQDIRETVSSINISTYKEK